MDKIIVRVQSDEIDGDDSGHEWTVQYILQESTDDNDVTCFDLYTDDGAGNGVMICRGYNVNTMRSMTLRLGAFVAWQ